MFDESKSFEEIGATVSAFIIDKTKNGLSNGSAQKYLLDTLTDYAKNTGDFEYAEKLLEEPQINSNDQKIKRRCQNI